MAKTQTELFTRALTKVGAVGAGETAASEDVAKVREALGPLLAELDVLQVISIVTTDDEAAEEIPDECFQALATLLAADVSADFGGSAPGDDVRQSLMMPLRRVNLTPTTGATLRSVYY